MRRIKGWADVLGVLGVILIALSADTLAFTDISVVEYLRIVAWLAIPLYGRWLLLIYIEVQELKRIKAYKRFRDYQHTEYLQKLKREQEDTERFNQIMKVANEFYYNTRRN